MPRLSIIIPLLSKQAAKAFEGTLASVLSSLPNATEVVVLDAVQYGDPWNVESEGVRLITSSLDRLQEKRSWVSSKRLIPETIAINEAVAHARGEIVHLLLPGTEVDEGWSEEALEHFENELVTCVAPSLIDATSGKTISHGMLYQTNGAFRSFRNFKSLNNRCFAVVPHPGAAFFQKHCWDECGGLDASLIPEIAYAHLVLLMHSCDRETILEPECRIAFSRDVESTATTRRFLWGAQTERLYMRWLAGSGRSSFLDHFYFVQREFWKTFPMPSAFSTLFGRFSVCLAASERSEIRQLSRELRESLEKASEMPEVRPEIRPENLDGENPYPERYVA